MYHPSFETFRAKAEQGNLIPVYREILADLETPVSAFLKIDTGEYSFLLESVEGGEKWARYSFLGSSPAIIFQSKGHQVTVLYRDGRQETEETADPLGALRTLMARYRPVTVEGLPRFFGGAVGYLSYDMVRFFEELPATAVDDLQIPDAFFVITDTLLIFDNVQHKIKVVSNVFLQDDQDLEAAYNEAKERIDEIIAQLRKPVPELLPPSDSSSTGEIRSNFKQEEFESIVRRAKEYIAAGDIFQVVLAQRLEVDLDVHPFNVYRALRTINPSPYMFYLKFGAVKLIGASPEVLVRLEKPWVEVRPIAGTRPRGRTEEEDRLIAQELLADPKERAEHIMLVDLGRNDVGRVAVLGSVEVNELLIIEKYSHVMHLVSNVRGLLAEGKDCYDVIRACFPAGTLSGAPKIRAMEIIEELEPTRRGPYGGAVGYFSFSGNMDTCITIRTLTVVGNTAYLGAGAGIVADSIPENEYQETMNKARALLKAIEMAREGL
ncbi:MAG: anthranilate synthase component I [Nitrospinota bacterium]|nr:MAG: anthranilate synthase component I [Nitrospinota bacterium]